MTTKTIKNCAVGSVYLRKLLGLYFKLDRILHVKCKEVNGRWVGDGIGEDLNPAESVQLITTGDGQNWQTTKEYQKWNERGNPS